MNFKTIYTIFFLSIAFIEKNTAIAFDDDSSSSSSSSSRFEQESTLEIDNKHVFIDDFDAFIFPSILEQCRNSQTEDWEKTIQKIMEEKIEAFDSSTQEKNEFQEAIKGKKEKKRIEDMLEYLKIRNIFKLLIKTEKEDVSLDLINSLLERLQPIASSRYEEYKKQADIHKETQKLSDEYQVSLTDYFSLRTVQIKIYETLSFIDNNRIEEILDFIVTIANNNENLPFKNTIEPTLFFTNILLAAIGHQIEDNQKIKSYLEFFETISCKFQRKDFATVFIVVLQKAKNIAEIHAILNILSIFKSKLFCLEMQTKNNNSISFASSLIKKIKSYGNLDLLHHFFEILTSIDESFLRAYPMITEQIADAFRHFGCQELSERLYTKATEDHDLLSVFFDEFYKETNDINYLNRASKEARSSSRKSVLLFKKLMPELVNSEDSIAKINVLEIIDKLVKETPDELKDFFNQLKTKRILLDIYSIRDKAINTLELCHDCYKPYLNALINKINEIDTEHSLIATSTTEIVHFFSSFAPLHHSGIIDDMSKKLASLNQQLINKGYVTRFTANDAKLSFKGESRSSFLNYFTKFQKMTSLSSFFTLSTEEKLKTHTIEECMNDIVLSFIFFQNLIHELKDCNDSFILMKLTDFKNLFYLPLFKWTSQFNQQASLNNAKDRLVIVNILTLIESNIEFFRTDEVLGLDNLKSLFNDIYNEKIRATKKEKQKTDHILKIKKRIRDLIEKFNQPSPMNAPESSSLEGTHSSSSHEGHLEAEKRPSSLDVPPSEPSTNPSKRKAGKNTIVSRIMNSLPQKKEKKKKNSNTLKSKSHSLISPSLPALSSKEEEPSIPEQETQTTYSSLDADLSFCLHTELPPVSKKLFASPPKKEKTKKQPEGSCSSSSSSSSLSLTPLNDIRRLTRKDHFSAKQKSNLSFSPLSFLKKPVRNIQSICYLMQKSWTSRKLQSLVTKAGGEVKTGKGGHLTFVFPRMAGIEQTKINFSNHGGETEKSAVKEVLRYVLGRANNGDTQSQEALESSGLIDEKEEMSSSDTEEEDWDEQS